ncbi:hypothetical protein [Pelagicoccus albus]|uniref:PEP-CTERM protein-sorting domain-containing protein n=1 Tax=Pelagicoccus albus TaxID=415222 RepID=A0A7X1BBM3_9BACT|nr:hypothetical protein [Pelagicoccus albus]MBC2608053.1 hypothetical protein [Pelagicoccus albus]
MTQPLWSQQTVFELSSLIPSGTVSLDQPGSVFKGDGYLQSRLNDEGYHEGVFEIDVNHSTELTVDISSLFGQEIESAFLNFDLLDESNAADIFVTSFTSDGFLSWSASPIDNLGTLTFELPASESHSLDVTSLVAASVESESEWLGLHLGLASYSETNMLGYTWTSGFEAAPDPGRANVTLAVVTAVPETSTLLVLAGSAIVTLALSRRRKSA